MGQTVNLSVSGLYTSQNDMNGLPPGALDVGVNVESPFKNILVPRNGFEGLLDSAISGARIIRMTNFLIDGVDRIIALTDLGDLFYYDVMISKTFAAAAVHVVNNTFTIANHGFTTGRVTQISNPGTLPTGISALTNYYVIVVDANTIKVATSFVNALAGTAVDITGQGTGTNTIATLNAWAPLPGDYSTDISPPDSLNAKSRFVNGGSNLYLTAIDGVRSLSSGSSAEILRAGVPKGLNLDAVINGDEGGFFDHNSVTTVTALMDYQSPTLEIVDITGIEVGQYVTGIPFAARNQIQAILYIAVTAGVAGNAITVAYTGGGTAGAEVVTVVGNAISVQIENGVSTANQIAAAVAGSDEASALVIAFAIPPGTAGQNTQAPTALAGGVDNLIPSFSPAVAASVIIDSLSQRISYEAVTPGSAGNQISIQYTAGGTAGSEVVSVVGNAISVQIDTTASTGTTVAQLVTAINNDVSASALVTASVRAATAPNPGIPAQGPTFLSDGVDQLNTGQTKVLSIQPASVIQTQDGDTTAGSTSITNLVSDAGIVYGTLVQGQGIPEGARVTSISGGGPYTVAIDLPATQTDTSVTITFLTPPTVTLDNDAYGFVATPILTPVTFYKGAQVAYRMVFGRTETDASETRITRVGAPTARAIATNISPSTTNVTVTATLPKNAEGEITFVQLFRSAQTDSIDIVPLDQYQLVYERALESSDFTARTISITDSTPDSLRGIPLYAGADREGLLQANNPPPACWDMCFFRDFALFGNITQPSTLKFTVLAIGVPNGIQVGDEITISGTFQGTPFSETYTAASTEDAASREFAAVTTGTPSQNITDTVNSLIRVINYDEDLPVNAFLLSTTTDLPGQILLETVGPTLDVFEIDTPDHPDAYDPSLQDLSSDIVTLNNWVGVSKTGEVEAVPAANTLPVGDSSADILRILSLRDYALVIKSDGLYKIQGTSPNNLVVTTFDLTTKIIGPDTAVSLNSAIWMYSNQGVVVISDGGVDNKSIPIDDQLNRLVQLDREDFIDRSFAVGYDDEQKYILSVPITGSSATSFQYVFNYFTNSWTSWDRMLEFAFIHSTEDKLYISRADSSHHGVSTERKIGTFRNFIDEGLSREIVAVTDTVIELDDVTDVEAGDVLYQSDSIYSLILSVDEDNNTVTVMSGALFEVDEAEVLKAFECEVTWKQVFGDNPAFVRQFPEGLLLLKKAGFVQAFTSFVTDFSTNETEVELTGPGTAGWGLFPWGMAPWGGFESGVVTYGVPVPPPHIRFFIPQDKQMGSYIRPTFRIKEGYAGFILQGISISHNAVSQEVGK